MAEINSFIGNVSLHSFLLFIFTLVFTFFMGGLLNILIIKFLRGKAKPIVYKTVSKVVMYGTYIFGIWFAVNNIIHFNITAGLAALGILGIAILLPAVPILQNIAAGIVLSVERPFKEEDIVEVNNELCKVSSVMLRKTKLRSLQDGKIIFMPNIMFMTSQPIHNYSMGEFIRINLNVDISADSNRKKAAEIIEKICAENPNILPNIPERKVDTITKMLEMPKNFFKVPSNVSHLKPKAMLKGISKDKVSLRVWFWIWDITQKESIIAAFFEKLDEEFKKNEIKFG
jgi:small conductance mechanosensitive channel